MLGVMSAFVFAGQMVNFPVVGGTSGHLLGGVLVALVMGPGAASMALACVLAVQCLLFQDGGITTFGANLCNLGLAGVWGGYGVWRMLHAFVPRPDARMRLAFAGVAAWFSVVLASVACGVELALSGTVQLKVAVPAMATIHSAIGVGEGLITASVLGFVWRVRPELVAPSPAAANAFPGSIKRTVTFGLCVALGVGILLAPVASSLPDGLEKVATAFGFENLTVARGPRVLPEYRVPWVSNVWMATALAAAFGVGATFLVAWGVGGLGGRRVRKQEADTGRVR